MNKPMGCRFLGWTVVTTAFLFLRCAQPLAATTGPAVKDDDLELLHQRFVASLLPGQSGGNGTMWRQALDQAARLRPDGAWADINYADQTPGNWATSGHLSRVLSLAQAWRGCDPSTLARMELRNKLMTALDYWLERDFNNPNWWHNQIGVPRSVGEIMLLLEKETTPRQVAQAVPILDRSS